MVLVVVQLANVNAKYSSGKVSPAQRGEMLIAGNDGNCVDSFDWQENVENAHVQQGAPTVAYDAPTDWNATNGPSAAPVIDYQDDYRPPFTRKPVHAWVVDADPGNSSNGSGN